MGVAEMTALQALHNFWSSFDWAAYDERTVPDDAKLPYITYESSNDFFGNTVVQTVTLWIRSTSWALISQKEQEIAEYIGRGGRQILCDGGSIWIKRASPWAQRLFSDSDSGVRRIVLNIELEFLL
jgi:hypothetical protein